MVIQGLYVRASEFHEFMHAWRGSKERVVLECFLNSTVTGVGDSDSNALNAWDTKNFGDECNWGHNDLCHCSLLPSRNAGLLFSSNRSIDTAAHPRKERANDAPITGAPRFLAELAKEAFDETA